MSGPPPIPRHAQVPPPIPASASSKPPPIPSSSSSAPSSSSSTPRRVTLTPPKTVTNLDLVFRLAMDLLLIAAVVSVWWSSTQRLQPLQQKSRALATENTKLSTRVEELDRKWAKPEIERIRADYREAYVKLFADESALRTWLDHL